MRHSVTRTNAPIWIGCHLVPFLSHTQPLHIRSSTVRILWYRRETWVHDSPTTSERWNLICTNLNKNQNQKLSRHVASRPAPRTLASGPRSTFSSPARKSCYVLFLRTSHGHRYPGVFALLWSPIVTMTYVIHGSHEISNEYHTQKK